MQFKYWTTLNLAEDIDHIRDRRKREKQILKLLENVGFSWKIYLVAASGFLASSWSLIATNIVSPALYYIYPPHNRLATDAGLGMDEVTLAGTIIGMIVFGHLADRLGRKALYGYELMIILSALGGVAFSSEGFIHMNDDGQGYTSSMDIYASIFWWRFALGVGIGSEYPMSAIIACEFSATKYRGTMMAAVFAAQSVGRLLAFIIGFGALRGIIKQHDLSLDDPSERAKIPIDILWRLVVGLAGVPAVLAIGLRLKMPETARFYSAVKRDFKKAHESAARVGGKAVRGDEESINEVAEGLRAKDETPWAKKFGMYMFGEAQGFKKLFAISLLWLLLDFAFYGTGLDSPGTLSTLWVAEETPSGDLPVFPPGLGEWKEDVANPNATIARTISTNAERTLELSSVAALAGSLAIIPLINMVGRRKLLAWTSAILAIIFFAAALCLRFLYATGGHLVSMILYAIAQFVFNLGPNTLTFVLTAEIFPTEFRGTCYGIAAASGKLGAVLVRPAIEKAGKTHVGLSDMLFVFFAVMVVMTLITVFEPLGLAIPPVQVEDERAMRGWFGFRRLRNLTLEEIAPWPIHGQNNATRKNQAVELSPPDAAVELDYLDGAAPLEGDSPFFVGNEARQMGQVGQSSSSVLPSPAISMYTGLPRT